MYTFIYFFKFILHNTKQTLVGIKNYNWIK